MADAYGLTRVDGVLADGRAIHYYDPAGAPPRAPSPDGRGLLPPGEGDRAPQVRVDPWTGESVLAAADNASEVGAVGCGNRLGAWQLQSDGTWALVADRLHPLGDPPGADEAARAAHHPHAPGERQGIVGAHRLQVADERLAEEVAGL